ncbi:hypothetical protein E2C01_047501 [Portunus trituberculatus]|uniref:Uncharacterized protein n=1 Tax=Portunus trituberculatus TaxID=210409 RepID=A0A5B7G0S1_PORTR|nr:hypothetical protein [Portunus trituberculatus]
MNRKLYRRKISVSNWHEAGHFLTSVRTSAPPYLRTTKRGAEVRSAEKFSKVRKQQVRKGETLSPYLLTCDRWRKAKF